MFRVDRTANRISRLTQKRFGDLALRERDHLQEWLVHQPDALGEDLLILQKEFDGFDETRERLDLLALDKAGNLVVIENKLDDSGRDVTWQALKYAAYTSGLTRAQIVDVHQQYLDRHCGGGNATQSICAFLEVEDLAEVALNPGNGQRILFVAANFRREVTATALWLISRGIAVQCFRVTPYGFGEELFLDLQQIIPPPEATDYMIGISAKEVEEIATQDTQKRRHEVRVAYWTKALQQLQQDGVIAFASISPSTSNWLWARTGIANVQYELAFTQRETRVALLLQRREKAENKHLFALLSERKAEIESAFGAELSWQRKDDLIQCQIVHAQPFDGFNRDIWPDMARWMSHTFTRFETAFRPVLAAISPMLHETRTDTE